MNDIIFTLKNKTNDEFRSNIIIFQKNENENYNEIGMNDKTIAWNIIENSKGGMSHTIMFPNQLEVSIKDEYENNSPKLTCLPGDKFNIDRKSGITFKKEKEASTLEKDFEIINAVHNKEFTCQVFRGGKLLSAVNRVPEGKTAKFEILPRIQIGVASQVEEGDVINSAIYSSIDTVFEIEGIKKADIIMRGGGEGKDTKPYTFDLVITEKE